MINLLRRESQIATILTLIIAAIFIFTVVILNLRRVTQRKAMLDNAADGAALFLASSLGSFGNKLAHEYTDNPKTTDKVETKSCEWDGWLIVNIGLLVASIIATIIIPGSGLAGVAVTVANIARTIAVGIAISSGLGLGGNIAHMIAIEPTQFQNFSLYFKNLTAEQQLMEGAIQYAAFSAIDDTAETLDTYDDNANNQVNDKILSLTQAYYQRLRGLPGLGAIIRDYFIGPLKNFVGVEEDPDTWEYEKVWIPDPQTPQTYFRDWLEQGFIPFLQLLEDTGYGVTFWKSGGENDDVDRIMSDIYDFEMWAEGILKESPDQRLVGFNQWYNQLFPEDPDEIGWAQRLTTWQGYLNSWIQELENRQKSVQECVGLSADKGGCGNKKEGCWPDNCENGSGCEEECGEPYCVDTDPETGECTDWDQDCWWVKWNGCCGPWVGCCQLCGEPCSPKGDCCNTCCRIQDNCDSATSKIVRALDDHLIPFKNKLDAFVSSFPAFQDQYNQYKAKLAESLKWGYEWEDSAGYHKVKVALKHSTKDLPLDIKGGPYLIPEREWWTLWTHKCMVLKNYDGDFRVVVSRYDREEPEGMKDILELLRWNKTITSEVRAHYGINKNDIRITTRIK